MLISFCFRFITLDLFGLGLGFRVCFACGFGWVVFGDFAVFAVICWRIGVDII